ncbi:hypothetical protein [Nonomuraea dietziae]|uniref:hypothetical protein n=1 Tax=Nonomuraea dietziae TaxID=65515 RepID=UPI0031E06925
MRIKPWLAVAAAVPLLAGTPALAAAPPKVPAGTTAGYVVFDRVAGKIVAHRLAHRAFRSASVIKILIAIDFLERTAKPSARDLAQLKIMLRSSDDDAASALLGSRRQGRHRGPYGQAGSAWPTPAPPPADKPGFWGYTSLSAYDVARTYRYLMDRAGAEGARPDRRAPEAGDPLRQRRLRPDLRHPGRRAPPLGGQAGLVGFRDRAAGEVLGAPRGRRSRGPGHSRALLDRSRGRRPHGRPRRPGSREPGGANQGFPDLGSRSCTRPGWSAKDDRLILGAAHARIRRAAAGATR